LDGVVVVFDAAPPDLACDVWDFDGVDDGVSVGGDVFPWPVALFMIRENIVECFATATRENENGSRIDSDSGDSK
jgi:hypothetical protein